MYPESMAISETLVASEGGGDAIKFMGIGFVISGIINILTGSFLNVINNTINFIGSKFYKWKFSTEVNPLLLGIGFIVGLEVSLYMFAGSVLANFGIAPLIGYFTDLADRNMQTWNDATILLHQMDVNAISSSYVKYIGAGMMLCGGIIGAIKLIPTIFISLKETFKAKSGSDKNSGKSSGEIMVLLGGIIIAFIAAFIVSQSITMAYNSRDCFINFILIICNCCWTFNWYNRNIKSSCIRYDNSFISYINISICYNGMDY